jgi:DNA-binding NarL/FixJ family response regulator
MIDSPLRLMLVDEDPVFRMGLRIWLEQTAGYRVVAEASQSEQALALLTRHLGANELGTNGVDGTDKSSESSESDETRPTVDLDADADVAIDLVILDLGLGIGDPAQLPGLQLCGNIKRRFPTLPVLVLSAQGEPVLAAAAQQLGADGFGLRGMPVQDLRDWIDHLTGRGPQAGAAPPISPEITSPIGPWPPGDPPRLLERPTGSAPTPGSRHPRSPWISLRCHLRQSALDQIDAVMAAIAAEQRRGRADLWTEAVMAGRQRELRAARWLMTWLLATPNLGDPPATSTGSRSATPTRSMASAAWNRSPAGVSFERSPIIAQRSRGTATPGPIRVGFQGMPSPASLDPANLPTLIFERVFNTFQGTLNNTSPFPQETDILREEKKRELLYLTLRKFEDALGAMAQANLPPGQLAEQSLLLLRDVWAATLTDFFGRYYTLPVTNLEQPVVPTLMAEAEVVQRSILDPIPLLPELLGHLLFHDPLIIDGIPHAATTPQALSRSQLLLEHLLLQVANGVIQPLLNCFADVELLKKNLYQRRLISSRDIERFRNDLSWRYRWDGLIRDPKAIFESQYRLWRFTERGIQTQTIYAPRREELDSLSGLQRLVTLTIEARDAVAPRFRSAISLVGRGIVYVLTDVIGRGIGLIGRGILRGVGQAWRDPQSRSADPPNPEDGGDPFV